MANKHIAIIGAGPGGLTSAMILANRGFKVSVFEARQRVGGRNGSIKLGDYIFDIGPTFLMLKQILDEVFVEAGTDIKDVLDIRNVEPMYRLQFPDRYIEPTTDHEKMKQEIARAFPGREDRYDGFFRREKERFTRLFPCLQKSYHKAVTMLHKDMIKALPHVAFGKTLFSMMMDRFGDEQLALSFTFQAKYLGMSPWECPGLFAMIPYIEHAYGIHHPIGGLSRISEAMADIAGTHGAEIHLNTPVRRILIENGDARGVELETGDKIEADEVIINADFGHAMTHLVEPGPARKWNSARLERTKLSCSIYMMYLGLDRTYDMPHHAVYFAEDYQKNIDAISGGKKLSSNISFYVRNAGVTDPGLAPPGHSAMYILVPVANTRGETDWNNESENFREIVLNALSARTAMKDIRNHIRAEHVITPPDWERDYRVYRGATFNLAHNLGQMLYFRPHNKFEDFGHCYIVGGGTHPGSGLPTIYESGRIAANLISRQYGLTFSSANLEI